MKLYQYFRKNYPDADIEIDKNFSNKRRTDLYIKFKSGERLAVEFQRTDLDKNEWIVRHDFYKDNGINDLWVISKGLEKVLGTTKQVALSYFEQIMLNEDRQMAVYLDINNLKVCLSKNIRYVDKYIKDNDSEKLFIKSYALESIIIRPDGSIKSNFYNEYEKEAEIFRREKEKESLDKLKGIESDNSKEKNAISKPLVMERKMKYNREQFMPGTKIIHRAFGTSEIVKVEGDFVWIKYGNNEEHKISMNNCLKGVIVKLISEK